MNEIYWLTKLDDLKTFAIFITAFAFMSMVICISGALAHIERSNDREIRSFNILKKLAIITGAITIVFGMAISFTPSTQEAYMIYGIGGTIDYVKSNESSKQLPDKCIIALDKYLTDEIKK